MEPEPAQAAKIFGDRIELARGYAKALARDSDLLGLLGPRELPKLWSRHVLNSAVVGDLLKTGEKVADLGSGAGLPGIPMAIYRPDCSFTLVEPMERRSNWLQQITDELGLQNVTVRRLRAEDLHDELFDVVTARAVAALDKLLRLSVPLTKQGGRILALKGQRANEEIAEARKLFKKLKIADSKVVLAGAGLLVEPTLVVETQLF